MKTVGKIALAVVGILVVSQGAIRIASKLRPAPLPYRLAWLLDNPFAAERPASR